MHSKSLYLEFHVCSREITTFTETEGCRSWASKGCQDSCSAPWQRLWKSQMWIIFYNKQFMQYKPYYNIPLCVFIDGMFC